MWLLWHHRLSLGLADDLLNQFSMQEYRSLHHVLGLVDLNGPNYPTNDSRVEIAFANAMKLTDYSIWGLGAGFANGTYMHSERAVCDNQIT